MAELLLYYITDRSQFPGDESARREVLLQRVAAASHAGVDYVQLREKDLSGQRLEALARQMVERVRGTNAKLLINSRVDVAVAVGADGVHLRSGDISVEDARGVFRAAGVTSPIIGVSCHSLDEIRIAQDDGADFAAFGPVFEKSGGAGVGLERLHEACVAGSLTSAAKAEREVGQSARLKPCPSQIEIPSARAEHLQSGGEEMKVFALGGVTPENAADCIRAGAAGIAGIRLFQSGDVQQTIRSLRKD